MFIVVFLSILDRLNHFHRTEAYKKFLSRAVAEHVAKVDLYNGSIPLHVCLDAYHFVTIYS